MACIMVWAAPVSRTQALQTAKTFMKQKGWAVSQQPRLAPRGAASQAAQNDYIYVFNSSNGFVVISGDDQTEPVLAYAEGGQFDETQIPANMKWWLGEYERQIRYIQENGLTVNTFVLNKPAISPMLSTDWSQEAPYSNKCPEVNGKACATGCLATAMAQVMNYHKWPQDATTSIPGYTTYSNKIKMEQLPATTFDWANMRSNYRYNSGTDAQKDAVAELMLYCGQATQMDYDPNGSGASEMYLANAFVNYFGYDESAQTLYRETYITPDWEEMVYNELANDRPVLYCGQSTGGGHAFVCDGYDGNGLYHIAWGWGWNSYFTSYCRLSILNPNTTTQTGASTTEDGFTFGQSATIGVRRPGVGGNTVPLTIQLDMDYTQVQGKTVHLCVGSMLAKTYSFNIALAILSDNGDKTIISQNTLSLTPMYQTWQYDWSSHSLSTSLFPGNGTYKIVPICRKNGTTEWSYMSDPTLDYLTATVNGSSLTIGKNYHTDSNISVTDMQFTGDIKTTADCELVVDVTNSGTAEFNTELYCFQSTTTSKGSAVSVAGAYVMPGETEQVYFYFKPKAKEDLTVWICTDEKGNNVIGQKTFPSPNIEFADANVKALCIANWDTNSDGELSEAEAAAVTDLGEVFTDNSSILSFDELHYFTGLISISSSAFYNCWSLTNIFMPNSVTLINNYAFHNCVGLTYITIPKSVTSIGERTFQSCSGLNSITIPNSVTSIGDMAFYKCSQLMSVKVEIPTPLSITKDPFPNRAEVTLYVPYGSRELYLEADYWKEFKEIVEAPAPSPNIEFMDANVKALCVANWDTNCDGELSEEEAASVTSLGSVFRCNNSITSFDELKHFIGLNSIGSSAFFGCSGLTSITIPNSVNNIGDRAFSSCDNLSFVNIDISTPLQITQNTFSNRANATLQVPCPSKKLYQAADYWNEFKKIVEFYTPTDISQKDNAIYIQPRTVLHGKNFKVEICMKNDQPATAYSFDLVLPEGVTVAQDENNQYMDVLSDRHVDHMRTINYKGNGTYSFAALSGNSELLQGNDGPIRIVTLHADDEMVMGDYSIVIQNARYSNETAESTNMDDTFITLTIEDFLNGDVNSDGEVDIADAVGIVNYIVGKTSANFEVKFADYNCDGYVDIADAVGIVNYIVGKNINKARRRTYIMREPQ